MSEKSMQELIRKVEEMWEETTSLDNMAKLAHEINALREEVRLKQDQLNFVRQEQSHIDQVSEALPAAMEVLSAPVPITVPLSEKVLLTVKEATAHTGVGQNRLRRIGKSKIGDLALWDGNKLMFKRKKLEKYLDNSFSI